MMKKETFSMIRHQSIPFDAPPAITLWLRVHNRFTTVKPGFPVPPITKIL